MSEPRIIPPEEARALSMRFAMVGRQVSPQEAVDLVHTAFVLGEEVETLRAKVAEQAAEIAKIPGRTLRGAAMYAAEQWPDTDVEQWLYDRAAGDQT